MSTGLSEPQVHIRYGGRSLDVPLRALDVGTMSTDQEIKAAIAVHLDVPVEKFNNYVVDRAGAEMTLRPEAVFG